MHPILKSPILLKIIKIKKVSKLQQDVVTTLRSLLFNIVIFSFEVRLTIYLLAFILASVHFVKNAIKTERLSAREDSFTTDISLNTEVLFSKKHIRITIFEFQLTFSIRNEHERNILLSEARKTV